MGPVLVLRVVLREKNQQWAFVNWMRCRLERERYKDWGISYFVNFDDYNHVKMVGGKEHIKSDEYLWVPTVMCRLEWSGTERPPWRQHFRVCFCADGAPMNIQCHCCKNNLPRRGDVPSAVKRAFSDLFPNLMTPRQDQGLYYHF